MIRNLTPAGKIFAALTVAAALGVCAWASAARAAGPKTVTLVPPATVADVPVLHMEYDACATGDAGKATCVIAVRVAIRACAVDSVSKIADCETVRVDVSPTNPQLVAIYTTAINAWKARKGY